MKIAIAGKNEIAVSTLKHLLDICPAGCSILAVPNPEDDGCDTWQPSFRKFAEGLGVELGAMSELEGQDDLILISVEYSRLIDVERFKSSRLYNLHFSLLPAYRGAYTSIWPILDGAPISGVTLHEIDHGIDTGRVVYQRSFPIPPSFTSRDLYLRYMEVGASLIRDHLLELIEGTHPEPTPQPVQGASFYSRKSIDFSDTEIKWLATADQVARQLRAFTFPEYQRPTLQGRPITSWRILEERSQKKPGTIVSHQGREYVFATIDYNVAVTVEPTTPERNP